MAKALGTEWVTGMNFHIAGADASPFPVGHRNVLGAIRRPASSMPVPG